MGIQNIMENMWFKMADLMHFILYAFLIIVLLSSLRYIAECLIFKRCFRPRAVLIKIDPKEKDMILLIIVVAVFFLMSQLIASLSVGVMITQSYEIVFDIITTILLTVSIVFNLHNHAIYEMFRLYSLFKKVTKGKC